MERHEIEKKIKSDAMTLSNACTAAKIYLVRHVVLRDNAHMARSKAADVRKTIEEIVTEYAGIASTLQSEMQRVDKISNISVIRTIDAEYVKSFAYSKYDYLSPIQYLDAVFKGIDDGIFRQSYSQELDSETEIDNMRNSIIKQAFGNNSNNVPSLLDDIISDKIGALKANEANNLTVSSFMSMKNNRDLFNPQDAVQLKKSIKIVLNAVTEDDVHSRFKNSDIGVKAMIILFGSILDFITYTVVVYMCRINILQQFSYPIINQYEKESSLTISESHEDSELHSALSALGGMRGYSLMDIPSMIINIQHYLKSANAVKGTISSLGNKNSQWETILKNNPIWNMLTSEDRNDYYMTELIDLMKSSKAEGNSKYNELLKISNLVPDSDSIPTMKSKSDCDKFIIDLYLGIKYVSDVLYKFTTSRHRAIDLDVNEATSYINELFSDIMIRSYDSILHVHHQLLKFHSESNDQRFDESTSFDVSETDEIIDLFNENNNEYIVMMMENAYVEYELYSEYLMEDELFKNHSYFKEDGPSKLVDTIKQFLKSLSQRIMSMWQNSQLGMACKWVTANKTKLLGYSYNGQIEMNYLPYKHTIKLPDGWDKFITELNSVNLNEIKDVSAWAKDKLYPSAKMAEVFSSADNAAEKYKNYLLFFDTLDASTEEAVAEKTVITAADMPALMKQWVSTVEGSQSTYKAMADMHGKIQKAIDSLNKKIVEYTSKNSAKSETKSENKPEEKTADATKNDNSANDGSPPSAIKEESALYESEEKEDVLDTNLVMQAVQNIITNVWVPIVQLTYAATRHQYSYIKNVYGIMESGKNKASTETQSETTPSEDPLLASPSQSDNQ